MQGIKKYLILLFIISGVLYGQAGDTIVLNFPKDTNLIIKYNIKAEDTMAIRTGDKTLYLKIIFQSTDQGYFIRRQSPLFFNKNYFKPKLDIVFEKKIDQYIPVFDTYYFPVITSEAMIFKMGVIKIPLYLFNCDFVLRLYDRQENLVKKYSFSLLFFYPGDE